MKKIFVLIAIIIASITSANADNNSNRLYWNNVLNNRFADNWELSLNGGLNYSVWNKFGFSDQGEFIDNLGWTMSLAGTKWFNPIVGFRIKFETGEYNVYDNFNSRNCWFMVPSTDLMLNLSNWIGGYKENRTYSAKIFGGVGLNMTNVGDATDSGLAVNFGLLNSFRISPKFDVNLELKSYLMSGKDMQREVAEIARKSGQVYSVTIGFTYKFNKRNWNKGVNKLTADDYLVLIDRLNNDLENQVLDNKKLNRKVEYYEELMNDLRKENKALYDQINNHKCDNAQIISTSTIFFDFDSYKLTNRNKASLDLLVEIIKNSNQKFNIIGHADSATGTKEYNKLLSEKRAKAVYDYMIEHGVNKDQLSFEGVGGVEMYNERDINRVVFVK